MDLSRLESLSREELNTEGRRIGVWAPARLSRAALERRIRDYHATPLRRAGRMLKKMVGIAREIRSGTPRLRLGTAPGSEATEAAPGTEAPLPAALSKTTPALKTSTSTSQPTPQPTQPTPQPTQPTPRPSTKLDARLEKQLAKEPIQTRTMAKILADQGYRRRALVIYQKLVSQRPDDAGLRTEMQSVRQSGGKSSSDDEEPDRDECVAVPVDDQAVVAWNVSPQAVHRASRLCGSDPVLVLRSIVLVTVEGIVERKIREVPVERHGERAIDVDGGSRLIAAVGLRQAERFVSIAHAAPIQL